MPLEIEHKFLVDPSLLPSLGKGEKLKQGYINKNPVVRIRIVDNQSAYLTIKGKGRRVRDEFEYPIPVDHAKKLLKFCGKRKIVKIRYRLGPWEIDKFKGKHKGLWLAEIELNTVHCKLPELPKWIKKEVTYDTKYSNSNLAERKFRLRRS